MSTLLIYGFLALFAPYAIFAWHRKNTHPVYVGDVTVVKFGLLPRARSSVVDYDLVTALLPDGSHLAVEVSKARLAKLSELTTTAFVTVSQSLFGARYVSSIRWAGETVEEKGDTKNSGLYLGVVYLLLGMFCAGFVALPQNVAILGHFGNAFAALLVVMSGWFVGREKLQPLSADGESRFLSIPMGKGRRGLLSVTLLAAVITAACFWLGGLFVLLGLNTGVALGMLFSLLAKPEAKSAS